LQQADPRRFAAAQLRLTAMRCLLAFILIAGTQAQSQTTAIDQLNVLQQKAKIAADAGDQSARIAADQQLLHLLNGDPDVLLALGRAYAAAGDARQALEALRQFADLGLADEEQLSGQDKAYASLRNLPEYQQILARFRRNEAPVLLAQPGIVLSDAGLVPEDIDYDPGSRSFLITSIREARIVRVRRDGSMSDFAASPDHWPMAALKIDAAHRRVWATEVAFDGFVFTPKTVWGRSAVLCFDLATGRLLDRIEGPPHTSPGDLSLTRDGDPIVSDGDGGGLYRVANGSISAIDTTNFISPQTSARVPGTEQLLVPDYARGIAAFSLVDHRVSWLNIDDADHVALNGIDGLYFRGHSVIITQNGTTPERVLLLNLDASLTHVVAQKVIAQATPGFDDPTHGVIVGHTFWFIANSGWAQLDEHGNVKPGAALTPARILFYKLD
jgi:hypothetical protein